MGGFRLQCLCNENVPSEFGRIVTDIYGGKKRAIWEFPLSFETMKALVNEKTIDLPSIALDEIQDKCGRDALSKAIAMLQLTWFILQIIARVRQSLAVTALELTTAALASLNIAMYISWWSKPTDIVYPTTLKSKKLEIAIRSWKLSSRKLEDTVLIWRNRAARPSHSHGIVIGDKERVNLASHYWSEFASALAKLVKACSPRTIGEALSNAISGLGPQMSHIWLNMSRHDQPSDQNPPTSLRQKIGKTISLLWQAVTHIFLALIYYPILAILESGKHLTSNAATEAKGKPGSQDDAQSGEKSKTDRKKRKRPTPEEVENMTTVELIIHRHALRFVMDMVFFCENVASAPFLCLSAFSGAIFGMIHCLAWNFAFPSHVEQILWRTSASAIAGLCICITAVALAHIINQVRQRKDAKATNNPHCQTSTSKAPDPVIPHGPTKQEDLIEQEYPTEQEDSTKQEDSIKQEDPTRGYTPTEENNPKKEKEGTVITEVACGVFAICFVLSRLSLLTLSVLGLRDLPASAFDTVQWAGFIPHI